MILNPTPLTTSLPLSNELLPELWDQVIDALADDRDPRTWILPEATDRALRNCALVCHNWKSRAKFHLRQGICIGDVGSLTGLSQRMGEPSTVLSPHVEILYVRLPYIYCYPPSNVLSLLPTLFRQGISSIGNLDVGVHLPPESQLIPREIGKKDIFLPYLPLHPRFSSLVTPVFSTVKYLRIWATVFKNFSDFGKFLNCFLRLEVLNCEQVRWLTLGVVPGCTTRNMRRTFLQNLRELKVRIHCPICITHA